MKATITLQSENKKSSITVFEADQEVIWDLIRIAFTHHRERSSDPQIPDETEEFDINLLPKDIRDWYQEQASIAKEKGDPAFYHTGIKGKMGIPHYKAIYECKRCGKRSKRYVAFEETKIACHDCKSELEISPVKGFPEPDQELSYFRTLEYFEE